MTYVQLLSSFWSRKINTEKYHTVGYNASENIKKTEAKSIPQTHIYRQLTFL
jgi:hypothetical protein